MFARSSGITGLLLSVLLVATAAAQRGRSDLDVVRTERDELRATLARDLEEAARFCEERELPEAAAAIRGSLEEADAEGRIAVTPLPKNVQPPVPTSLPDDERTWRLKVRQARTEHAGRLYLLARRALRRGLPSAAHDLIREVTEFDSDHESARRLLGWVRNGDEWITPFDRSMMVKRYVWHERFGWLRSTHVERYEQGQRYFKGKWISAAREADIRRDFRNAWEVETAHYLVKTNHSLEEGVRIARALELYHDFLKQVFAGFFTTPDQQKTLFDGATRRRAERNPPKYEVHFHRSKDDYVRALQGRFPQIAITNGLYQSGDRVAYFFHDPAGKNLPTIFHEATHQILYESDPRPREVGIRAHFWIVEGIACYMESFTRSGGQLTIGDPNYIRFDNARFRLLQRGDYEPFGEFSSLGMRAFQNGDQETLGKRYSEASGLAHFLMHYDGGRYRDALVAHLADIYSPTARRVRTIPELLGVTAAEIDEQYAAYLREQRREVANLQP